MTIYEGLSILAQFSIGIGLVWIAYLQYRSAELARRKDRISYYEKAYESIIEAIEECWETGTITGSTVAKLWKAYASARIYFPIKLREYVKGLLDTAHSGFVLQITLERLEAGDRRTRTVGELEELTTRLQESKPHDQFRQYMKVD